MEVVQVQLEGKYLGVALMAFVRLASLPREIALCSTL